MIWKGIVLAGAATIVSALVMAYNYYGVKEMSDLSQQNYLRLYGEGIYEYHDLTGKWPSKIEELARTSLPLRYPHWWKAQLGLEADVIVVPIDLKPEPRDNGHIILCYHNKGLDAEMGRMWVCWGDLRAECITLEELRDYLRNRKK